MARPSAPAALTRDSVVKSKVPAFIVFAMILTGAVGFAVTRHSSGPTTSMRTPRDSPTRTTARSSSLGAQTVNLADPAKAKSTEPAQSATAEFTFHRVRAGYKSSFYVLGEVRNTSPFPISKPEIITVLLDAAGKEVGTDNGYATKDHLEPGEESYVSAIISDPPAYAKLSFEVVARRSTFRQTPAERLRLMDATMSRPYPTQYKFTGKVENGGSRAARFLNVMVLAFDGQNKLLGLATGYAKTERLEPGQSARYQIISSSYPEEPTRFETTVSGKAVD